METAPGPSVDDSLLPSKNLSMNILKGSVDDSGMNKVMENVGKSSIVTTEPYMNEEVMKTAILYVYPVPLDWNFDIIHKEFSKFGSINEIRNRLGKNYEFFESWIIFSNEREALRAYN